MGDVSNRVSFFLSIESRIAIWFRGYVILRRERWKKKINIIMEQNLFLRAVERDEIIPYFLGKGEYFCHALVHLIGDMRIRESIFMLILLRKWRIVFEQN